MMHHDYYECRECGHCRAERVLKRFGWLARTTHGVWFVPLYQSDFMNLKPGSDGPKHW
jgi:hypothetical protein